MGPRKRVLKEGPDAPTGRGTLRGGAMRPFAKLLRTLNSDILLFLL